MKKEHIKKGDMVGDEQPEDHEYIKTADQKIRCKWCGDLQPE